MTINYKTEDWLGRTKQISIHPVKSGKCCLCSGKAANRVIRTSGSDIMDEIFCDHHSFAWFPLEI